MKSSLLALCLLVFFIHTAQSQTEPAPEGTQVIVMLKDKSEITGELINETDKEVIITSASLGLLTFQKTEVKRIIYLNPNGRLPNPNPTKYFLGQSAYTLNKGEGYYQNIYGLVNLVSYGFDDRFSALIGTEIITLFSGSPIILANLKYGIPISEKLQAAASLTYLTFTGDLSGDFDLGSLNALLTYGNKEHNVTFGTGYALANGSVNNSGILTIGGMTRLGKRLGFISENYVLLGEGSLVSGGLRYISKKSTVDLLIFQGGFPAIDIVLKF